VGPWAGVTFGVGDHVGRGDRGVTGGDSDFVSPGGLVVGFFPQGIAFGLRRGSASLIACGGTCVGLGSPGGVGVAASSVLDPSPFEIPSPGMVIV
jgi:hypothetical protein